MNSLPSESEINLAISELGFEVYLPHFIEQVLLAWDFVDAQLSSGYSGGKYFPNKHQVENWAGFYICADAVSVALHLHCIQGINRCRPTFPLVARLNRHEFSGVYERYTWPLVSAVVEYDEFTISTCCTIDSLFYRGAEGGGFKRVDFLAALNEYAEFMAEKAESGSGGGDD